MWWVSAIDRNEISLKDNSILIDFNRFFASLRNETRLLLGIIQSLVWLKNVLDKEKEVYHDPIMLCHCSPSFDGSKLHWHLFDYVKYYAYVDDIWLPLERTTINDRSIDWVLLYRWMSATTQRLVKRWSKGGGEDGIAYVQGVSLKWHCGVVLGWFLGGWWPRSGWSEDEEHLRFQIKLDL